MAPAEPERDRPARRPSGDGVVGRAVRRFVGLSALALEGCAWLHAQMGAALEAGAPKERTNGEAVGAEADAAPRSKRPRAAAGLGEPEPDASGA